MANTQNMPAPSRHAQRFKPRAQRGQALGLHGDSTIQMVRQVQKGFPYAALIRFHKQSGLSIATIADLVQLPQRTLMRRKATGRLRPDESERSCAFPTSMKKQLSYSRATPIKLGAG